MPYWTYLKLLFGEKTTILAPHWFPLQFLSLAYLLLGRNLPRSPIVQYLLNGGPACRHQHLFKFQRIYFYKKQKLIIMLKAANPYT